MAETIENQEVFVDLMGNELREVSRMVSEVSGPSITMEAVLGEALSWGPYVTLLVRCRKDPASLASATLLFLQAKGVKVSLAGVKEYIDTAIQRCGVVPQADGIVEMFTAAVQMLATFMMGSDTAELVQKTPLWSNAMRVAHWLLLGPLHLMLGGIGGVKRLTEFYDSVFPSGSGLVSVVTSITALFKAVWEYGLPVLTGKMTLSEALARNQAFAWLVECQEAIVNCSDYSWLQERGYLSETTQALTIEFEQYVATLRTQGKLHAAAYATSSGTLFTQVVAMEKQLCLLASRIRALRTGIENKVQPVCIVLLSVPGCQKSTFQMLILRMVWDCLYPGCKFDNSMVASVNPAATRLDNVNGQTRILVIDDAAQYNLEYTKNPIVANPMNFVNTVPTMLDQAEITRKGTEMMNHQAVLINSNTRSMQILRINTCPQAAFRRIWRTLVIAPKNGAKVGSHAVGRVLSIEEMNTMYDFSVEQYDFSGGEINVKNVFSGRKVCTVRKDAESEMVTIHTDESKSFAECVAYLKTNLESYLEVQRAVVSQKEVILAEELCGLCGNVDKLCVCKKEPTAEELDDGSGVGTSIVPAVPQMRETLLTGVLGSAAAVVGLGLLVGPVRRKVVKKVTDVTDTVSTLANEAIGTMRSVADLANAAKCILESAKTEFASFKADMRRKAFATLQYSLQVGCVVLLVGAVFVGVRRFFFKAVVPQAMEAFTSVGFVPPLNTHKWPKGVHTPYVYNPHEPNALKAKVPMNKTLSILEKVEANLVIVYVATGDVKARHVYGLALGPGRILLTYHIFRGMEGVRLVLVSDRNKGGLSNTRTLMLDMSRDVFQIGEKDYCIIAVGTSSYYPVTCFPAKGGKDMEVQANVYRYDENTLEDIRGTSHLEYCKRPNGLGVASEGYSYTAMAPYGDGACGTIITTSVLGPPYVVGLHSLGEYDGSYGWTEALYDFEVEAVMKKMDLGSSPMAGLRYSGKFNGEERDGADHPHGRTIFPHVQGFGSYEANFKTLRTTDQASSFERTPLFEKVREVTGMKLDIPNLKARVEDGDTYVDPLLRAAVLNSSPPGDFDPELLDKCFDDYFDDLEAIPGFDWEQVGFLSLDQALNGEPAAVNSINFASAAGPWVGRKKRDHVTGEPGSYKLDETMQKAIDSILSCWDECESAGIMYSMKQKDEPRNENKMPRVFSAGPFAETILTRMLFGGFYEYVKKFRGKTEHAVGINCGDPVQWDEVIQAFGGLDTMVECQDASDFDLRNRMAPHVPYQILRRWRMRIGHKWSSLDDLTKKMFHYAHCLAREQFFFLRSYRGEVVLQSANQPSGRSYTTEVNSMCTSVYERMYFYTGARMKDDLASWQEVFARWKFAKHIKLLDFGDDYLKHNKDCDWYTMELRLALARNLGMEYSMPDKESAMTLLPLRKAEFLKRGFGYVNDVAVAPLDMKSILKSFAFFRRSGSLTKRQAMEEAALNAHAQLYMHGREVYEEKSKLIKEWLESLRGHPDYGNVVDDVYPVEDHGLGYDKLLELHKAGQYNETATGVAPQSGLVDLSTLIVKISDMNHNFDGISGMPDYAAASGVTAVDGVSDSGVPRSVANAVEQPATVQMPAPLAVHHLGHGTIHGNSVAQYHDSLSEFLTRPVKIATFATTIGATSNVNPWALFLLNPLVYEKIKAFAFIRGTLHIRFVMSASQFVQGRVYVGYNPAGARDDLVFDRSSSITTMSHLPYAGYIDPGIANDVEWSIPYHESRPYTPVFEVSSMGGQLYSRVAVPYENANTGTPSATNISVLAWMTDVELVVAAQPQSAKSASGGMMSKALIAASGGLQAAAKLVDAKNVSTAFHAVGDALSAFGFTREIDTRDHMPVRLRFTSGWAATEGAEASYPLTADPLAEKTVATDYAIGVEEDELIVAKMAGRYSYVDSLSWTESSSTLEQYYVTPINAGYSCVWAASAPFAYWRGSMKYKFSAVRTMFHKGKLLVKWSPGVLAADSSLNTGYSVIWDLDATPEIEILIPYNLDSYWSKTGFSTETGYQSSNGFLSLYVLEPLTGPSDVLSVPIHVFIAGGPDFAVSCPTLSTINNLGFGQDGTGVFTTASGGEAFPLKTAAGRDDPVYPQAGESDFSLEPNMFVLGPPSSCKEAALRSMGEQTVSFRELLKRKQRALTWPNVTTEMKFISTYPKSALALVSFPGGVGTLTTSPYDVTLMSYLMAMFMGISGSTKWDIVPAGATNLAYVMRGFGHPSISYSITAPETGQHGTLQGGIASRADFDGVVSVVSPQYIRGQFSYIANYYQDRYLGSQAPTSTATLETQDNGFFASSNAGAGLVLTACVAAGDDFNLLYFLGPPTPLTIVA